MARGPKKHLKRINTPRSWLLSKMGGIYATRPSQGPHKLRECLPLSILVRYFPFYADIILSSPSMADKSPSFAKINKPASKLIIKSEPTPSSPSEFKTSLPSSRPTRATDSSMTSRVDSFSTKLKILRPNSNFSRSRPKPSD